MTIELHEVEVDCRPVRYRATGSGEPLEIRGRAVQRDLGLAILLGALGKRDRDEAGIFGIFRRTNHEVRHAVRAGVDDHVNQLPRCTICATDRCSQLELHFLAA